MNLKIYIGLLTFITASSIFAYNYNTNANIDNYSNNCIIYNNISDSETEYSQNLKTATGSYNDFNYNILNNETAVITFYSGVNTAITIPSAIPVTINGVSKQIPVSKIGSNAFTNNTSVTEITIPSGVTAIEGMAFYGCTKLSSIVIPASVTTISGEAFNETPFLDSHKDKNGLLIINSILVNASTAAGNLTLPDNLVKISSKAFANNASLSGIIIPSNVCEIEAFAFSGCSSLTNVALPNTLTEISTGLFYDCSALAGITLPSGITSIEDSAFSHCVTLKNIILPDNLSSIGVRAFYNCYVLNTITLPANISLIDSFAFYGCKALNTIYYKNYYDNFSKINVDTSNKPLTTALLICTKLKAPTLKSLENSSAGVYIKWTNIPNSDGYYVYRKNSAGTTTLTATINSATTLSYTDSKPKGGQNYSYVIKAFNSKCKSESSNKKTIRRLVQPTISSLTNASNGVTIKWNKISGAVGYYVYRKNSDGVIKKIVTLSGNSTTTFLDKAPKDGQVYHYSIKAYGGGYLSARVSEKKTVRLKPVSIQTIYSPYASAIYLQWTKNSFVSGYDIRYKVENTYTRVSVSGVSTLSKVLFNLAPYKTYTIDIQTYKAINGVRFYSAFCPAKKVYIPY